ncbi:MAG: hypothetical protein AB1545_07275 [Thermodesulfobacteriota bacterium]|jgi:hypothetical protein
MVLFFMRKLPAFGRARKKSSCHLAGGRHFLSGNRAVVPDLSRRWPSGPWETLRKRRHFREILCYIYGGNLNDQDRRFAARSMVEPLQQLKEAEYDDPQIG